VDPRVGGRAGGVPSSALLLRDEEATAREGGTGRSPPRRPRRSRRRAVAKREDEAMANGVAGGGHWLAVGSPWSVGSLGLSSGIWALAILVFGPSIAGPFPWNPCRKGKKIFYLLSFRCSLSVWLFSPETLKPNILPPWTLKTFELPPCSGLARFEDGFILFLV
jgi:hypothetical protein